MPLQIPRVEISERRVVSVNGKAILKETDDGKWHGPGYETHNRAMWELIRLALNRLAEDEPCELPPVEAETGI